MTKPEAPTDAKALIAEIIDARQKRAETVHEKILEAREKIRTHLHPESPSWQREAFDILHAAHHILGGDPFDMHTRAALTALRESSEKEQDMKFENLVGKTLVKVYQKDDDELHFVTADDEHYMLYHEQDCCEYVHIEDIAGNLEDLIGNPILVAAEVSQEDPAASDSGTWTFYKLATVKGWVDVRWYGSSNGYYSESVDFTKVRA